MDRADRQHEYPPADWDESAVADALDRNPPDFPVPDYADADEWAAIRDHDLTAPLVESVLQRAAAIRDEPIPELRASHYLRWRREDDITQVEIRQPLLDRLHGLSAAALAECVERDGRFLDTALDYAWAICEQSLWSQATYNQPDSRNHEGLPVGSPPPEERNIPLRTVLVTKTLAEVDYVLGDQLHPALRRRIRNEVDERIFQVYEERDDFWWLSPPTNNWNAAINGQSLIAALYLLDDVDRQAAIATQAATNMEYYLQGFDQDGCTAEGVSYWNFGFGNYVQAAANLETRTGGAFSLFDPPVVERIADFPLAIELSPDRHPAFSDASERNVLAPYLAAILADRFDHRTLGVRARRSAAEADPDEWLGRRISTMLRTLAWVRRIPSDWEPAGLAREQYFGGCDWWIARDDPADPDGLVVAAKGGHNDESHNHNDCGSFVVHYGGESLLTDLGKPFNGYPNDYWDPVDGGTRFDRYLNLRSIGHSVPYVNGTEQAAGDEFAATVTDRHADDNAALFAVDLAGCYPDEAGVESLERTVRLDRGDPGHVTADDAFQFADATKSNTATSVLISKATMTETTDGVTVDGDVGTARVTADADSAVEIERLDSPVVEGTVTRARFEVPCEDGAGGLALETSVAPE